MYNYFQRYYPPINKCSAYRCQEYCSIGSDKWCQLHEIEMYKLNTSSDDLILK